MKKKIISALLTCLMIVSMLTAVCPMAIAAPIELTVGVEYPATNVHTVTSEKDIGLVTGDGVGNATSETKNGITVTATLSEDKKSLDISYSGTPQGEGSGLEFKVTYAIDGEEKTYTVMFNIAQQKVEVLTPEIISAEPNNLNQTFKQSDPEVEFSVEANGNGEISYEWKLDGKLVSTDSKYTLIPAELSVDEHVLECKVENTIENTTKHDKITWNITIEKTAAPVITSEAESKTIDGTGSAVFTVTAEGEELKYQWYMVSGSSKEIVRDGEYGNITYSGAETSKLKISCDMAPQDASVKFICEIINPDGLFAVTDEYTLNIKEDPEASKVQKIEIASKPDKTEYTVGETLDQTGLKILVTTGKDTEEITSGFVCSPQYLEEEGTQEITVSYGGKTTTFKVTVNKAPHEHKWSDWQVEDTVPARVSRVCVGGDDCEAKEVLSKESFIVQYPTLAEEMGLRLGDDESEVKDEDTGNSDTGDTDTQPEEPEKDEPEEKDNGEKDKDKKNGGIVVLWIIIIIAILLLAGVILYYLYVYKKPYKKPNSDNKNIKK